MTAPEKSGVYFCTVLAYINIAKEKNMAVGWTDDDAVLEQIQDTINDEIHRARKNVPSGESLEYCEECGEEIPEARRKAIPGVRLCVDCQEAADKENRAISLYNRRGSKDSQLR